VDAKKEGGEFWAGSRMKFCGERMKEGGPDVRKFWAGSRRKERIGGRKEGGRKEGRKEVGGRKLEDGS
jgi:hypothetical protein